MRLIPNRFAPSHVSILVIRRAGSSYLDWPRIWRTTRPLSRLNPWCCEPVSLCCFAICIPRNSLYSYCIPCPETRKTYRAILSEPRIVVPISSSEPAQATEPSTAASQAGVQLSTTNGPQATSQGGRPASAKKRCREPDFDTVGSAATTETTETIAPTDRGTADGPPARKKKRKKQNGAPRK